MYLTIIKIVNTIQIVLKVTLLTFAFLLLPARMTAAVVIVPVTAATRVLPLCTTAFPF